VDKMKMIHERTLVIAMIETKQGLENVDAIAAVPGVDALWLGHFDLSNFLGIPGQFGSPVFQDAIRKIVGAAQKHGKAAGYMAADAELGREYLKHGFRLIATGTDQGMLQAAIHAGLAAMRKA
jgi:2-dehydro-3-deoxyglucarate aldolase/4-hydroxy-2-oxoheptanedioate aldolase